MQSRSELEAEVLKTIASVMKSPPATFDPDASLADVGLDSLGLVEVMFVLEETYGISVSYNANEPGGGADFGSLGSMLKLIIKLIEQGRDATDGPPASLGQGLSAVPVAG